MTELAKKLHDAAIKWLEASEKYEEACNLPTIAPTFIAREANRVDKLKSKMTLFICRHELRLAAKAYKDSKEEEEPKPKEITKNTYADIVRSAAIPLNKPTNKPIFNMNCRSCANQIPGPDAFGASDKCSVYGSCLLPSDCTRYSKKD